MLDNLAIKARCTMVNAKTRFADFLKKEKGGSEIIAVVMVIAIVLVLAAVFWEGISKFFGDLWNSVTGKNPINDINATGVLGGGDGAGVTPP